MKRKKVYISGPMTGLPRRVYMLRFAYAERILQRIGFRVCNPAMSLICRWPWLYRVVGYRLTLLYDLWLLRRCQYIYLMPGWESSNGARLECCDATDHNVMWLPPATRSMVDGLMNELINKQNKAQYD